LIQGIALFTFAEKNSILIMQYDKHTAWVRLFSVYRDFVSFQ